MKKLAMILLSCAMVFGMTGCGSTEKTEEELQEEAYEKYLEAYSYEDEETGRTTTRLIGSYSAPMNDNATELCPEIGDDTVYDGEFEGHDCNKFFLVTENGEEKLYYISYLDELGVYNGNYYVNYYTGGDDYITTDLYFGIYYNVDDNTNWSATHIYSTSKLGTEEAITSTYETGVDETYMVDELKEDMENYLETKGLTLEEVRYALQYVKANGQ